MPPTTVEAYSQPRLISSAGEVSVHVQQHQLEAEPGDQPPKRGDEQVVGDMQRGLRPAARTGG